MYSKLSKPLFLKSLNYLLFFCRLSYLCFFSGFSRGLTIDLDDLVEALCALGCSHVQVVAWEHWQNCTEIALKFLVKHEVELKPTDRKMLTTAS